MKQRVLGCLVVLLWGGVVPVGAQPVGSDREPLAKPFELGLFCAFRAAHEEGEELVVVEEGVGVEQRESSAVEMLLGARLGLTDRFQLQLSWTGFRQIRDRSRLGSQEQVLADYGLGSLTAGASYQLILQGFGFSDTVEPDEALGPLTLPKYLNVRIQLGVRVPTGQSTVASSLYAVQGSVEVSRLVGNTILVYGALHADVSIPKGEEKPGAILGARVGASVFVVPRRVRCNVELDGQRRLPGSGPSGRQEPAHGLSLAFGLGYKLFESWDLDLSLGVGLFGETPDLTIGSQLEFVF